MSRPARYITFNGETLTLSEWSKRLDIPESTLAKRADLGVPLDLRQRAKRKLAARVPGIKTTEHPLYQRWKGMRARCYDVKHKDYPRYGGRGVRVCAAWNDDFWTFVADVGECPGPDYELDRKDNAGDYEPGNVQWSTKKKNGRNKRNNNLATWQGETLPVAEWADRFAVTYHEMWGRVRHYKGDMAKVVRSIEKLKAS